ncbi:MAG: N-acetylmannosamine-6-phosphate 2-epimerase [Acidobacteria bacterium]|nr:N-acetylmannosamine-6-phosphate 2-epimerase [Acidobacteriota bacterium]
MIQGKFGDLKLRLQGGLIVSCQAPENSPLSKQEIIAAFAEAARNNGARGVRIDSPVNIRAVRERVSVPIIGIHKIVSATSDVYITPTLESARAVADAGADVIAFDATDRARDGGATALEIALFVANELRMPTMADVATLDEGVRADEEFGCDFVGTTLSGYTRDTAHRLAQPDFALVEALAKRISAPIICEGRIKTPADVRRAFDCGAFAVVVGKAITGIDELVRDFVDASRSESPA